MATAGDPMEDDAPPADPAVLTRAIEEGQRTLDYQIDLLQDIDS